jgi:hypothetical protein
MKLLHCNGRELEVRDVGPVVFRLTAGGAPIKLHGWQILDDDAARALLRELREASACVCASRLPDGASPHA